MATVTRTHPDVKVLYRVPYKAYVHLSNASANRHLKLAYHDGTLEIVSPRLGTHEEPTRWISLLIPLVAERLGLRYHGSRSTTFRRAGKGIHAGKGKEPDESFYIASLARLPRDRDPDLDAGDPPPDLWIEVDNRVSSAGRLPIYAALGVPEVWRYRSRKRTMEFLRLVGDSYEPVERSLSLPPLTPALVLEALALGDGLRESEWIPRLRDWADRTIDPRAGGT